MEREVGGGIRMGNTCKPMADSFQYMTKPTTIKKLKKKKKENEFCQAVAMTFGFPFCIQRLFPSL